MPACKKIPGGMFTIDHTNHLIVNDNGNSNFRKPFDIIYNIAVVGCRIGDKLRYAGISNGPNDTFSVRNINWLMDCKINRAFGSISSFLGKNLFSFILKINYTINKLEFTNAVLCHIP